jgi:hypothetical protein
MRRALIARSRTLWWSGEKYADFLRSWHHCLNALPDSCCLAALAASSSSAFFFSARRRSRAAFAFSFFHRS